MKLHLGCGSHFFVGWIHIDSAKYPHIDNHDITLSEYKTETVDQIYVSHLLSYFNTDIADGLLNAWCSVLKPGGKMYISVPDFKAMAKLYLKGEFPIEDFIGPLYGRMKSGNKEIYHRYAYDLRSLSKKLHKAGFRDVEEAEIIHIDKGIRIEWPYKDDQSHAFLPDRNKTGTLISLNLIATK